MKRTAFWILSALIIVSQSSPSQNGWTVHGSNLKSIYCIKAVDQNVAWIGGDSGRVSLTTDGGSTWNAVGGGAIGKAIVWNIDAISASVAYVTTTVSSTTYIYRTTDGGTSWSQVFSQAGGFINDIHMIDAANGVAYGDPVGGKWTVLRTTDGGGVWARLSNEPTPGGTEYGIYYNSLSVVGSSHIWFIGSTRIYRSTDGGATWSFGTLPASTSGLSVWFNTASLGLATINRTTGGRSIDSGQTWTSIALMGSGTPYSLAGAGTTDFWYADGNIYRSTDSGSSWTLELPGSGNQWFVLDFVTMGSSAVGYAASFAGAVAQYSGTVTSVQQTSDWVPTVFHLDQNYPNPFNPSTTIKYELPQSSVVRLSVYDMLGREVSVLVNESKDAGVHEVRFDGSGLASGFYLYRLQAGNYVGTKKLLLLR